MTLTLDEVRKTKFHMARRTGYEVSEVDLFVDRVEASFAQLTEENQSLRQQLDTLKQAQAARQEQPEPGRADQSKRGAEPVQPEPPRAQVEDKQPAAAQGGSRVEKVVVTTSNDASPAVVRLVQLATQQAEQLVSEANAEAKRTVDAANEKAQQITTESRTKAERLESDARTKAEHTTGEAQNRAADLDRQTGLRRTEMLATLEQERDQLQESIAQLRGFEASYRESFRNHLQQQLQHLNGASIEPTSRPALAEPGAKPAQSGDQAAAKQPAAEQQSQQQIQDRSQNQGTTTPRLDALLGENRRDA